MKFLYKDINTLSTSSNRISLPDTTTLEWPTHHAAKLVVCLAWCSPVAAKGPPASAPLSKKSERRQAFSRSLTSIGGHMLLRKSVTNSVAIAAVSALAFVGFSLAASSAHAVGTSTVTPASAPGTTEVPVAGGPSLDPQTLKSATAPYWGRVIARHGLLVRSGPSTRAKVIGALGYGQVVGIECKVSGQNIDGNPRWYKLADNAWAWASARYVANIGTAPSWCPSP